MNFYESGSWRAINPNFDLEGNNLAARNGPWNIICPDSAVKPITVANRQRWDVHAKTAIPNVDTEIEVSHLGARPVSPVIIPGREYQVVYPDAIEDGIDIVFGQWHGRGLRAEHLYVFRREPAGNTEFIEIRSLIRSGDIEVAIPTNVQVDVSSGFSAINIRDNSVGIGVRPAVAWYFDAGGQMLVFPIQVKIRRTVAGVIELTKYVPRALIAAAIAARPNGELRCDTTSTFYPNANPETTSVDGWVVSDPGDVSWATLHDAAAGTTANDSGATLISQLTSGGSTDTWSYCYRSFMLFDTSAISDTDNIDSGTLSLYGSFKDDNFPVALAGLAIYGSTPASNTSISTDDYDQVGSTLHSATVITAASFSTSGYNDFALNATGLAAVNKTGVSKFGARIKEDGDNSAPAWSAWKTCILQGPSADNAGTASDPKLVIVHTPAQAPYVVGGGICVPGGVG